MAAPVLLPPDISTYLDETAAALASKGYIVLDGVFSDKLLNELILHFKSLDKNKFRRAGIGREDDYQLNRFIRTDEIHWLNGTHQATREYFERMEVFRLGFNERLFLGLFDYECHYAYYNEGAFYKKHLDAFADSNTRVVSTVLYLNPSWSSASGGELVMYSPGNGSVLETIAPLFGRLVLFLSEEFPHEVLPVNVPRYSLTGWFRKNNSIVNSIDPLS